MRKSALKKIVIIASVAAYLISTPSLSSFVLAAASTTGTVGSGSATYKLLEPLPCVPSATVKCTAGQLMTDVNLNQYIQYAFNLLIALSAVAAVVMIVAGGFEYMTSVSMGGKANGLDRARNAVYGLLMVLCTYIILKTVNPQLVNIPTTLVPAVKNAGSTSPTDLLNQINAEANAYNEQAQASVDQARAAKENVANLQKNQADLELQREDLLSKGFTADDPEVQDIEAQIQDNQNKIASSTAAISVNNQMGINTLKVSQFIQDANGAASTPTIEQIQAMEQTAKNNLASSTNSRINELQQIGAVDQIQPLQNQEKCSDSLITIASAKAQVNAQASTGVLMGLWHIGDRFSANPANAKIQNGAISTINAAVTKCTSLPNVSTSLVQQVQQAASEAINYVNNMTYHYD